MRGCCQKVAAAALAGVAALAFVVAPLLHAEVHVREEQRATLDRAAAFDRVFEIVFSGTASGRRRELLHALDRVLGETPPGPEHADAPGGPSHWHGGGPDVPRHSHGSGPHGSGSLQHFAAALQASPARPLPVQPAAVALAVAGESPAVVVSRTAWLVEQSQGPPRA